MRKPNIKKLMKLICNKNRKGCFKTYYNDNLREQATSQNNPTVCLADEIKKNYEIII